MKYASVLALVASQAVQGVEIRKSNSQMTSFAQEFINDLNHTCDFAHRRIADVDQPNVADLIAAGDDWEDASFPKEDAIDWDDHPTTYRSLDWLADSAYLQWSRMSDEYPASEGFSLFGSEGIRPGDVQQGSIGNCWFLSAAAAVAEVPGRFEKIWLT